MKLILKNLKNKKIISKIYGLHFSSSDLKNPAGRIDRKIIEKEDKKNGRRYYFFAKESAFDKFQQDFKEILETCINEKDKKIINFAIKGTSNVKNAKKHTKNRWMFKIDFKSWYNQLTFYDVKKFLIDEFNVSDDVANLLANLLTYTVRMGEANGKRVLPQGFRTSPILSYLCKRDVFINFANKFNNFKVTLYFDDLIISSDKEIPVKSRNEMINYLKNEGIKIKYEKIKYKDSYKKHINVTGVKILKGVMSETNKIRWRSKKDHQKKSKSPRDGYIKYIRKINNQDDL